MRQQAGIHRLGGKRQLISIGDHLQPFALQPYVDLMGNRAFVRGQLGAEHAHLQQMETEQLRPPGLQLSLERFTIVLPPRQRRPRLRAGELL